MQHEHMTTAHAQNVGVFFLRRAVALSAYFEIRKLTDRIRICQKYLIERQFSSLTKSAALSNALLHVFTDVKL